MNVLADLVRSAHACVYAYGVVAAFADDAETALDAMAAHRHMRDELMAECRRVGQAIPPASVAYPLAITDDASARATAGRLENALCAQWASAVPHLDPAFAHGHARFAVDCALRGYHWTGTSEAFPS